MSDTWKVYEVYRYRNGIGQSQYRVIIPVMGMRKFRWRWRAERFARKHKRAALRKEWKRVEE